MALRTPKVLTDPSEVDAYARFVGCKGVVRHENLEPKVMRAAVVVFQYVKRLCIFENFTLRDFVDCFRRSDFPEAEVRWWQSSTRTVAHAVDIQRAFKEDGLMGRTVALPDMTPLEKALDGRAQSGASAVEEPEQANDEETVNKAHASTGREVTAAKPPEQASDEESANKLPEQCASDVNANGAPVEANGEEKANKSPEQAADLVSESDPQELEAGEKKSNESPVQRTDDVTTSDAAEEENGEEKVNMPAEEAAGQVTASVTLAQGGDEAPTNKEPEQGSKQVTASGAPDQGADATDYFIAKAAASGVTLHRAEAHPAKDEVSANDLIERAMLLPVCGNAFAIDTEETKRKFEAANQDLLKTIVRVMGTPKNQMVPYGMLDYIAIGAIFNVENAQAEWCTGRKAKNAIPLVLWTKDSASS